MASTILYPLTQRPNGFRKGRLSTSLPSYSSAVHEKLTKQPQLLPWIVLISLPIPGLRSRRVRLPVLNIRRVHHLTVTRFGRKRGSLLLLLAFLALLCTAFSLTKHLGIHEKKWSGPFARGDPPTLVFKREDLQRIWQWEIASGHYPSRKGIPEQLGLRIPPNNPALPPRAQEGVALSFDGRPASSTRGVGAKRVYLDIQAQPPNVAYPPRPVPGSVADLDIVMEHCDFSEKKFVRDCLEVLRVGAGLDNGKRVRRGKMDKWMYIYMEQPNNATGTHSGGDGNIGLQKREIEEDVEMDHGLTKRRGVEWEQPPIALPPPRQHRPHSTLKSQCDPDSPRIFHMFWTGPFTDKPYLTLLSFLFSQNTGLHLDEHPADGVCRPKLWLWINPGPAASVPNPSAIHDMFEELKSNPWASPFLHPRFRDIIQFKLWNTTEQLDGVPEVKDEWRSQESLFNSGGQVISVPAKRQQSIISGNSTTEDNLSAKEEDDMLNRAGSKSSATYDRLSVILSDLARFVLCHRFGGIYLDADTIFLRDWEELWGWKGAFAYRWSRMEKYNTAVLHLNKGSALGTFLFRTALKNGLDFHPMTVSKYTKEAHLDNLLLRLPDALFDSAWLNTEYYQRDRPPQPYFTEFIEFFDTPAVSSAAPQVIGFEGFFRGAYSYHFHNFWWKPFDPARNWPDLGPKFIAGELIARAAAGAPVPAEPSSSTSFEGDLIEDDLQDLDWATVLKRTFEAYIRGERPNMYGEWLKW
ncbi:hypothetical protein AX16_006485 [Volvariella volvacea WC 439]|nr:hypothetical protein AX16_006485 [Volvariella volvacea WC 439]